jgi:hypothetical protein
MVKVVLVSIVNFQSYILENIKQLLLFGNKNITVITEEKFFKNFPKGIELIDTYLLKSKYADDYYKQTCLDSKFRGGFWQHCFARFFYIHAYMKQYNCKNIIHLENDVLTYINLDKILKFIDKKMMIVMDSEDRCIPSIIYCKNYAVWEVLFEKISFSQNDMQWLGTLYKLFPDMIGKFPIIDKGEFSDNKFNGIFDAAAMGQYLGGVDSDKNTVGFINETCVIKYDKYKFIWKKRKGLLVPYLVSDKEVRIFNLHIHCKDLKKFSSVLI